MNPLEGIDLAKLAIAPDQQFQKDVESSIQRQIKGIRYDCFNLAAKRDKLINEHKSAITKIDADIASRQARLDLLLSGDWSALEPFELELKDKAKDPQPTIKDIYGQR